MHLLNRLKQYKAYKNDKFNFIFMRMLFAKFTQAHAAFGRGICHLSDGYFLAIDLKLYTAIYTDTLKMVLCYFKEK